VPEVPGTHFPHATVSFSAPSAARLLVYQPKLVMKVSGPDKVIMSDPATFVISVSNPGDAVTERVKVVATLSDGLEHARGKTIEFDVGNLAPRESRCVQVLCNAKMAGEQVCEAQAMAEPGLTATDSSKVEVLIPGLQLSMNGPGLRYLDRHAILTFKVT